MRLRNMCATAALGAALLMSSASPTFASTAAPEAPSAAAQEGSRDSTQAQYQSSESSSQDAAPATPVFRSDSDSGGSPKDFFKKGSFGAAQNSDLTEDERSTVALFDRNTPSVVNISNLAAYARRCA